MRIPVRVVDRFGSDLERERYYPKAVEEATDSRHDEKSLEGGAMTKKKVKKNHKAKADKRVREPANGSGRTENGSGGESPGDVSLDWKDMFIRLRADFDNYKKHQESERDRIAGIGKEAVLQDVFPLIEYMERAIKAAGGAGDSTGILEGLEMVYREMIGVLEKHGAERIPTDGQPFDPKIHEAVAVIHKPGASENTIVEEIRPGFVRKGKLLRPASVVVAQ